MHIALVGMMGSGKSAVGRGIARRLHRKLADTDWLIEHRIGRSISAYFSQYGEDAFRRLAPADVADVLAGLEPLVVSTGGGIVARPENREALRAGATVVWLRARPDTLAERVMRRAERTGPVPMIRLGTHDEPTQQVLMRGDAPRPLVADALASADPEGAVRERLEALSALRSPLYEEVADVIVDVDGAQRDATVTGIIDFLGLRPEPEH